MNDPLLKLPEQEKELFEAFRQLANKKPLDAVYGAAINVIVNAIRQVEGTRAGAEARYDELFGKGKTLLLDKHYDSVTGRRRSVFPFTQVVKMPLHWEDDDIRTP
jgi:hypothetical protein